MKLLRLFLAIAIVSAVTFSCKKSDKEKVKDDVQELKEDVKDAANDAADAVKNAADATGEAVKEAADATGEAVSDAADAVNEAADEAVENIQEAAKKAEAEIQKQGIVFDYPKNRKLQNEVTVTMHDLTKKFPKFKQHFNSAYAYAIFPKITKAGLGVGGAAGKGLVFEQNTVIGSAKMTQASVGAQIGGQTYSEIIFFKNKAALNRFKNNKLKFAAEASAVALKEGVSADLNYQDGVAVFTYNNKGLMAEASIGAQKFKYHHGIQ